MNAKQLASETNTRWFFWLDIEEDEDDIIVYFIRADKWFNSEENEKKIVKPTKRDILELNIIAPTDDRLMNEQNGYADFLNHAHIITNLPKDDIVEILMDWGFLNLNVISELDSFDEREMNLKYYT